MKVANHCWQRIGRAPVKSQTLSMEGTVCHEDLISAAACDAALGDWFRVAFHAQRIADACEKTVGILS